MVDFADDNNGQIIIGGNIGSITFSHGAGTVITTPTPIVALPPREHVSMLKSLDVSQKGTFMGINFTTELGPLLSHLPNLQELRVNSLTKTSVKALATHCKNLEVLEYLHNPALRSSISINSSNVFINSSSVSINPSSVSISSSSHNSARSLFASCPKLRVFKGIDQHVKANDMIREQWVCQGIEILRCRIVGVVRLTKDEQTTLNNILASHPTFQHDSDVSSILSALSDKQRAVVQKHLRSREQQRQIYERLASFQHLKCLDIGFEIQEYTSHQPRRTPDTLELSLESGLGQLGSLKNLEMFGFEGVEHRIGRKELEWMAGNWPELKLMHGLVDDHFEVAEPSMEKPRRKEYMQALRPDIVHVSFFRPSSSR